MWEEDPMSQSELLAPPSPLRGDGLLPQYPDSNSPSSSPSRYPDSSPSRHNTYTHPTRSTARSTP
ncbi:hypothetical protein EON64_13450, partial [archaeon]